jgi:hypothetical protein
MRKSTHITLQFTSTSLRTIRYTPSFWLTVEDDVIEDVPEEEEGNIQTYTLIVLLLALPHYWIDFLSILVLQKVVGCTHQVYLLQR